MHSPMQNSDEKKSFAKTLQMMKSEAGSALMIALFSTTILLVAAMEIVHQSTVEFLISSQQVNQVKAYYAAKSGVEISLLRLHIYKKAYAAFGSQLPDPSMLEMIWSTPFAWPPPVPEELNAVDKDSVASSVKNSAMKSPYVANISAEGAKIDLNDLASPSTGIQKATRKLLIQVFTSRIEADQDNQDPWAKEYRDFNFEELVDNMADWVDADTDAKQGGAENRFYQQSDIPDMPPNRPFQSVRELHMVAGMTDAIYEVIAPRVTTYGSKAVNVNHASKQILMALDESITSEIADKIIESRNDPNRGPFKSADDFLNFGEPLGMNRAAFQDPQDPKKILIPLAFDPEFNFRIEAIGTAGKVTRKITALVYDVDRVKGKLVTALKAEATPTPPPGDGAPPPAPTATPSPTPVKAPTDRPTVVYWAEE